MSFKILCYFLMLVTLKKESANGAENKSPKGYGFEVKNSIATNGAPNVQFKIHTNLREEILNSQREEFAHLVEIVKELKQELKQIKTELEEQKQQLSNFIKIDYPATNQRIEAKIENEILKGCSDRFTEKINALTALINAKFSNQETFQTQLAEKAKQLIEKPALPLPMPVTDSKRWNKNFECIQDCGPIMDLPESCADAVSPHRPTNGVYLINVKGSGLKPFFVYCKMIDNKVWTIFQRRGDGSENFYRNWTDYKEGFGSLNGEFWLGLDRLHAMTNSSKHELHVWLENKAGKSAYARYDQFLIGNESEKFRLTVANYSGNAGDGLQEGGDKGRHNGMKFSTFDNCNDLTENPRCCAISFKGAWWFRHCYMSHLNGQYNPSGNDGVDWNTFNKKLKYSQMAIRRV